MPEFERRQNRTQNSHLVNPARPDRTAPQPAYAAHSFPAQQLGNQAMQRFAQSCPLALPSPSVCPFGGACHACPVQAKLTINEPGDKYEQEADRVADQVMRMPEPPMQRQVGPEEEDEEQTPQAKPLADQITPLVQRQIEPEEEEEEEPVQAAPDDGALLQRQAEENLLQAKAHANNAAEVTSDLESRMHSPRGGGHALPRSVRDYFEPRFGYDFSGVRLHTDSTAAEMARSVNARAVTRRRDILIGAGQYSPDTSAGKRLLAHELTHVVQQSVEPQRQRPREPSGKPVAPRVHIALGQAHQIMREVWSPQDRPSPCNSSPAAIQQEHHVELGPVPAGTENCVFTPLFRVPVATSSVQVEASAVSPPPGDWRINVFECPWKAGGSECGWRREDYAAAGKMSSSLSVDRSPPLWVSRKLFVRIRNGGMSPIPSVRLTIRVRPITLDSISEIIHTALQVLGLTPALGVIPDAVDTAFYLVEGNWVEAGISAAAMVPIFGQGAGLTRLGIRVSRESVERLGREGVEQAIALGVVRSGTRVLRPAPAWRVVSALRGFRSRVFRAGSETFLLDSGGMSHILKRHHPRYWDGSVKGKQSFFDEHLSVDDVADAIQAVMRQNRERLIEIGSTRHGQISGMWGGLTYVLGVTGGRVSQFFPL